MLNTPVMVIKAEPRIWIKTHSIIQEGKGPSFAFKSQKFGQCPKGAEVGSCPNFFGEE